MGDKDDAATDSSMNMTSGCIQTFTVISESSDDSALLKNDDINISKEPILNENVNAK